MKQLLKLKALFLAGIFTAAALLSGCADSPPDSGMPDEASQSYVKKRVSYEAYVPAEDIALPYDHSAALGAVQSGKSVYILLPDSVYSLDTETGECKILIERGGSAIAEDGESLYILDSGAGGIFSYGFNGEKGGEWSISELAGADVIGFEAADGYFAVLINAEADLIGAKTVLKSFSMDDGAPVSDVSDERITSICGYKDGLVLAAQDNTASGSARLLCFDPASGELKSLRQLANSSDHIGVKDIAYNERANTVLSLVRTADAYVVLCEDDLDSEDNVVLDKYRDLDSNARGFVSCFENAVITLSDEDSSVRVFDYENPPQSLTVAYQVKNDAFNANIEAAIDAFESETGAIVRTTCYNDDLTRLNIKLLAGDGDIDIYACSVDADAYIKAGVYVDLTQFDTLAGKIAGNVYTDFACGYNGGYFGVPYGSAWYKDCDKNPDSKTALEQYCIKNIDSYENRFDDGDGGELYELLKYHAENPDGKTPLYDIEYSYMQVNYLMINPASDNAELSAVFLECLFDTLDAGTISFPEIPGVPTAAIGGYPELESTDNLYLRHRFAPKAVVDTIYSAYNNVSAQDSGSRLKKEAEDAAERLSIAFGE